MELRDRIKLLRIKSSMTQKELSNYLKVSELSVRNWETGVKNPSITAIIALAKIFNVTTDFLLGVTIDNESMNDILLSKPEKILLSNYRALDKYGRKAVDTLCLIEKSRIKDESSCNFTHNVIAMDVSKRYIPKYETPSAAGFSVPLDGAEFEMMLADDNVPNEADFAVKIQGNSMYPYINDGDIVFVKKNYGELSIGDIGIFCVNGAMYCKQYFIDEEQNLTLISANPEYQHTNIFVGTDNDDYVKCYGKVLLDKRTELPNYVFIKS